MDLPLFPIGLIYIYISFFFFSNDCQWFPIGISHRDICQFSNGMAMSFLLKLQLSLGLGLGTCDVEQVALGMRFWWQLCLGKGSNPMGKVWGQSQSPRFRCSSSQMDSPKKKKKDGRITYRQGTRGGRGILHLVFLLCLLQCSMVSLFFFLEEKQSQ